MMEERTLSNVDSSHPGIKTFGNPDNWLYICKAWNQREGWFKSTKALPIPGFGCVMQVSTQQRDAGGRWALSESLVSLPGVSIEEIVDDTGKVITRGLGIIRLVGEKEPVPGGEVRIFKLVPDAGIVRSVVPSAPDPTDNPVPVGNISQPQNESEEELADKPAKKAKK